MKRENEAGFFMAAIRGRGAGGRIDAEKNPKACAISEMG